MKTALPTVSTFLAVLGHKIVAYDRRHNVGNIYALGHYLEALHKIERDMGKHYNATATESLLLLKCTIIDRFAESFPPATATLKQIDGWLANGKRPRL